MSLIYGIKIKYKNMKTRNITVTLNKAKEWFNSENAALKELALQVFSEDELIYNFREITTFEKACKVLGLRFDCMKYQVETIALNSRASAAMFQLNIIRKALNLGHDLSLTENPENSYIYYPYNPFVTKDSTYHTKELNLGEIDVIGKIKSKGTLYTVLSGGTGITSGMGLGYFSPASGVGYAESEVGFLGCASKEIAKHFGKYFGMLITEAKYADMIDFKIIENKYGNV